MRNLRVAVEALDERLDRHKAELDHAFTLRAVERYDAFDDIGGQQSASIALLDRHRSGVVMSSIHSRDYARLYVKQLRDGVPDRALSPEEERVVGAVGASLPEPLPAPLPAAPAGRAVGGGALAGRAGAGAGGCPPGPRRSTRDVRPAPTPARRRPLTCRGCSSCPTGSSRAATASDTPDQKAFGVTHFAERGYEPLVIAKTRPPGRRSSLGTCHASTAFRSPAISFPSSTALRRQGDFDLVYAPWSQRHALALRCAAGAARAATPVVCLVHSPLPPETTRGLRGIAARVAFRGSDALACISAAVADGLRDLTGRSGPIECRLARTRCRLLHGTRRTRARASSRRVSAGAISSSSATPRARRTSRRRSSARLTLDARFRRVSAPTSG